MNDFWDGFSKQASWSSNFDDLFRGMARDRHKSDRINQILEKMMVRDGVIGAAVGGGIAAASTPSSVDENTTVKRLKAGAMGTLVGALSGVGFAASLRSNPDLAKEVFDMQRTVRARAKGVKISRKGKQDSVWKSFQDAAERVGLTGKEKTKRDVDKVYKGMAKKFHPDKGGRKEDFMALKKDYEKIKTSDWFKKKSSVRDLVVTPLKAERYGKKISDFASKKGKLKSSIKDWFLNSNSAHQMGYTGESSEDIKKAKNIMNLMQYSTPVAGAAVGAGSGAYKAHSDRSAIDESKLSKKEKEEMKKQAPNYLARALSGAALGAGLGLYGSRPNMSMHGLNRELTKSQRAAIVAAGISGALTGRLAPLGASDEYKEAVNEGTRDEIRRDLEAAKKKYSWLRLTDEKIEKEVKKTPVPY